MGKHGPKEPPSKLSPSIGKTWQRESEFGMMSLCVKSLRGLLICFIFYRIDVFYLFINATYNLCLLLEILQF
jgi:hypothetical protein